MGFEYKPYEERPVSTQYRDLLNKILEKGVECESRMHDSITGEPLTTRELLGELVRFDLRDGAPIITERDISGFYKQAIGELLGFINGARTLEELEQFGCKWWKPWLTEEKCAKRGLEPGDMGPGSYSGAFHDFPMSDGRTFNQFKEIIQQMREYPELKTHDITPWIPQYTIRNRDHKQGVVVCPCHGWLHFTIRNGKLHMSMRQRSCDAVIGLPSNWTQYTALLLAMSNVLGLEPGEFIHYMDNVHIYSNSLYVAEELVKREPAPFPTLEVVKHHDSLFDYRNSDFELRNYHPKEKILKIPVGV